MPSNPSGSSNSPQPATSQSTESGSGGAQPPGEGVSRRPPSWLRSTPFFLSGLLYLSYLFTLFAPLPLLFYSLKRTTTRNAVLLAVLSNALLVGMINGASRGAGFLIFVGTIAVVLPHFLVVRRAPLERAVLRTLFSMLGFSALLLAFYGLAFQESPLNAIEAQINQAVQEITKMAEQQGTRLDLTPDEMRTEIVHNLPSVVGIFSLIMVWVNLMIVLRVNPDRIRERLGYTTAYFSRWKAPEMLIWPTIAFGALAVLADGTPSVVGVNAFKFLMAIYGLQGLSVVTFCFNTWNIRGFFRSLAYVLLAWPLLPMLLAIGFFDLWFDFRAKLRQS